MEKATDNLNEKPAVTKNFIELAIDKDLAEGKYTEICTRFPPDSLAFLSSEGMVAACPDAAGGFCMACFNGDYPTK